jgi:hypothetical protein
MTRKAPQPPAGGILPNVQPQKQVQAGGGSTQALTAVQARFEYAYGTGFTKIKSPEEAN